DPIPGLSISRSLPWYARQAQRENIQNVRVRGDRWSALTRPRLEMGRYLVPKQAVQVGLQPDLLEREQSDGRGVGVWRQARAACGALLADPGRELANEPIRHGAAAVQFNVG